MNDKIKIAIVDDEKDVRDRLIATINQFNILVEIVAVYENGYDAYESLNSTKVDILITDIRIPYIDGLELARLVKKEINPLIKIIIITGFDEIDYTKQAINLEVSGFLTKPVLKQDLFLVLEKAISKINEDLSISRIKEELLIEKNKYKISILENLFKRLIDNNSDNTQTILSIKDNDIILENKFIHLVLFSLDNLTEISLSDEGYLFLQNEISKSIYKDDFILFRRNKYFYLYIFLEIDPNIYELGTFLTSLINKLKVKFSFKTYACISRVFTTNDSFYNIYLETKRTLDFASEENEVFYPPSDYKVDFEFVEEKWYKALSNIINSKGTGDAILFINQKISELKNKSHIAFQLFISECLNTIISTSNNKVKTNSMTINTDIYQKILSENNIFTTLNYFTELINAIKKANKEEIFNIQETNSKYLLDYLNNSFTDPMLSLHYVSKEIGLSPSYIAFLLKSYSDTTFVKYVTILRIDYAKKLIASNKYKITAISKMVGYQDPYYFSHCFKKYSGVSPKNYIEK